MDVKELELKIDDAMSRISYVEKRLHKNKNMLEEYLQTRTEMFENIQNEARQIKESIPDFDEEIYKKYKAYYDKEIEIFSSMKIIDKKIAVIKKDSENCIGEIDFLKDSIRAWEEDITLLQSEK